MKDLNSLVQEYQLPNGLKVLIKEDHSAPVYTQSIFYRVGSRNDITGQTGIAHYLEHMQFNGTPTRPKGAISGEIEKRGGSFNAATSTDFTMYYMTLPSENLDFSLELEADRMRNSILNKTEAEREKQVVLAELAGGENNPMSLLSRELLKAIYPEHPYGRPIIGWKEEVQATTAQNLKDYYDTYYQPNNAVLILVGDINGKEAITKIKNTLGKVPKSDRKIPELKFNSAAGPTKNKVEVKSPSETSILTMAWKAVSFRDKDYVPLSVLSAVLTNGMLSRLERALVDTGKASSVNSSTRQGIDPFTFTVLAFTSKDGNLQEIQKIIETEIQKIQKEGISSAELERVKAKAETSFLFGLEDSAGLASQLGFFELVAGDWKRTFSWPQEIENVTVKDVQRVAQQYLSLDKVVIGTLVNDPNAKGPHGPANGDIPAVAHYKTETTKSTQSSSDKGIQAEEVVLENGLRVILRQNASNPVIAISGTVDAGEVFDVHYGKPGVSALTGLMLERGSKDLSRDRLNEELENIGAEIEISPEKDYLSISAKSRSQDYEKLIDLMAHELRHPLFERDELERFKMQLLLELNQSRDDLSTLGKVAFFEMIYGPDHPYFEPDIEAQIKSLQSLTVEDLQKFHKEFYQPNRTIISVSGDFKRDELLKVIEKALGDWKNNGEAPKYNIPLIPLNPKTAEKTIQVPGKSQALILMGHAGFINRSHPDFYALLVANDILGGGSTLSSRLGTKVREDAGLVYTIRSSFSMSRGVGPFIVQMGVAPNKIQEAIDLTKQELKRYSEGNISDAELERAKNYRSGFFISNNLTTNENVASSLNQYALWGMPLDIINQYPSLVKNIQKEDIVRVVKRYLHPDNLNVVVAKPAE